jgi:hypothetical protein
MPIAISRAGVSGSALLVLPITAGIRLLHQTFYRISKPGYSNDSDTRTESEALPAAMDM